MFLTECIEPDFSKGGAIVPETFKSILLMFCIGVSIVLIAPGFSSAGGREDMTAATEAMNRGDCDEAIRLFSEAATLARCTVQSSRCYGSLKHLREFTSRLMLIRCRCFKIFRHGLTQTFRISVE